MSSPRSDQSDDLESFSAESLLTRTDQSFSSSHAVTGEVADNHRQHVDDDESTQTGNVPRDECNNLLRLKSAFPISMTTLNIMEEMEFSGSASSLFSGSLSPRQSGSVSPRGSGSVSPEPRLLLGHRASPTKMEDSPIQTKRRCMNGDINTKASDRPKHLKFETPTAHIFDESFDSTVSSPTDSPCSLRTPKDIKIKYKKDELWAAIESDYQYLMDEEIIDACKVG